MIPSLLTQARLVRRSIRRMVQLLRYGRLSLAGVPILFANSFPKSGTHLLTQVLQGFQFVGPSVDSGLPAVTTYIGETGRERSTAEILTDLKRLLPGDIAYGHLHARSEVVERLCQPDMAAYFILRDPRDVVVSHVHYVTDMEPDHIHHDYYANILQNYDQRLRASILGLPGEEIPFPNINQRFEPYLGWLERGEVLCLRFEEFNFNREAAIGQVYDHAVRRGFPSSLSRKDAVQALAGSIDPSRSPTFRSGKVGSWQGQFSQENKELFKEIAGDLLVRLGYEQDQSW